MGSAKRIDEQIRKYSAFKIRCQMELERIYGVKQGGDHGNQYAEAKPNNSGLAKSQEDLASELGIFGVHHRCNESASQRIRKCKKSEMEVQYICIHITVYGYVYTEPTGGDNVITIFNSGRT